MSETDNLAQYVKVVEALREHEHPVLSSLLLQHTILVAELLQSSKLSTLLLTYIDDPSVYPKIMKTINKRDNLSKWKSQFASPLSDRQQQVLKHLSDLSDVKDQADKRSELEKRGESEKEKEDEKAKSDEKEEEESVVDQLFRLISPVTDTPHFQNMLAQRGLGEFWNALIVVRPEELTGFLRAHSFYGTLYTSPEIEMYLNSVLEIGEPTLTEIRSWYISVCQNILNLIVSDTYIREKDIEKGLTNFTNTDFMTEEEYAQHREFFHTDSSAESEEDEKTEK